MGQTKMTTNVPFQFKASYANDCHVSKVAILVSTPIKVLRKDVILRTIILSFTTVNLMCKGHQQNYTIHKVQCGKSIPQQANF